MKQQIIRYVLKDVRCTVVVCSKTVFFFFFWSVLQKKNVYTKRANLAIIFFFLFYLWIFGHREMFF